MKIGGPGYRVHVMQRGMPAVLPCGGDEIGQRRDSALAKAAAAQLKEDDDDERSIQPLRHGGLLRDRR